MGNQHPSKCKTIKPCVCMVETLYYSACTSGLNRRYLMYVCMCTGVVTDPKAIALSYIVSVGFVLDTLAVLPLEALAPVTASSNVLNWAITYKINRILKLWKV